MFVLACAGETGAIAAYPEHGCVKKLTAPSGLDDFDALAAAKKDAMTVRLTTP
ncbi:MAG TPA: hypothetical protein VFM46_07890 [Pseudomonadales bacterium]|nr:hypothetical protein [Pseudomonadales bacterium]